MTILVYVDALIITGNHSHSCTSFKALLNDHFRIKDLGPLKYFLDIDVACSYAGLLFFQCKYTIDIPSGCGMLVARPSTIPMEQQHHLCNDLGTPISDPS